MNENIRDIVKLGVDAYRGTVTKYSKEDSMETLRQALVEANGGSEILTYKSMRDHQADGLFAIIEEILQKTVVEGLQGNELFNQMVDFRNIALGDENKFLVEDATYFRVDEIAEGHQGIRRQRLEGLTEITIPTRLRAVKIYEELNRILAGRVDFNYLINKVAESFRQQLLNDIYSAWNAMTATDLGGTVYMPYTVATAGAYSENALLDLIAHVEAASDGKQTTILGTKKALRKLYPSIAGEAAKNDSYYDGFVGKFFGSDVVALPQRHAIGTTNFILPDTELTIIASGDQKPIKVDEAEKFAA